MTLERETEVLKDLLAPLCGPLHGALSRAEEVGTSIFGDLGMLTRPYDSCRSHLVRAYAHFLLAAKADPTISGWRLLDMHPNTPLALSFEGVSVRMLKAGPRSMVPPPGKNRKRLAFYSNGGTSLLGVRGSNLLGVWEFVADEAEEEPQLGIRIVRPVGDWKMGSVEKVDVDFWLPVNPDELQDLKFVPLDEDEWLLPIELESEEEEEKGNDG